MAPLYPVKSPKVWAKEKLEEADRAVTHVERVFFPDGYEADVEVLFLDADRQPKMAYLTPRGEVLRVHRGW